ncbi:MAG: serine/threonine-protein kinase [Planctomycetota bacterium]
MNDRSNGTPDDPVEAAVAAFVVAWQAGKALDQDEFCQAHPECAPELKTRIDDFLFPAMGLRAPAEQPRPPREADANGKSHELPATIGDYRIIRELGRGAMGAVYLAEQQSLKRRVALKTLHPHFAQSPNLVGRFHREATAVAKLHHPGIVPVHSFGEEDGVLFFAMEYIDGHSLHEELERIRKKGKTHGRQAVLSGAAGRSYVELVAEIGAQVADALECAHARGVIHRDIKPQNILLDKTGKPLIVDFGLAKDFEQETITLPGEVVGTPRYFSPEQTIAKTKVDQRTDIFSLGVVLYEMLTLEYPFGGETHEDIFHEITVKSPRLPRELNPVIPRALERIVLKALEKDPDRRYPTAGEMAKDLRDARATEGGGVRLAVRLGRSFGRLRERRGIAVRLAGVSLIAVACLWVAWVTLVAPSLRNKWARELVDQVAPVRRAVAEAYYARYLEALESGDQAAAAQCEELIRTFDEEGTLADKISGTHR